MLLNELRGHVALGGQHRMDPSVVRVLYLGVHGLDWLRHDELVRLGRALLVEPKPLGPEVLASRHLRVGKVEVLAIVLVALRPRL